MPNLLAVIKDQQDLTCAGDVDKHVDRKLSGPLIQCDLGSDLLGNHVIPAHRSQVRNMHTVGPHTVVAAYELHGHPCFAIPPR